MKIIYLATGYSTEGVNQKLEDKILSLRKIGMDCTLYIIVPHNFPGQDTDLTKFIRVNFSWVNRFSSIPFFWRTTVWMTNYISYRNLHREIDSKQADVTLIRYPVSDSNFWRFIQKLKTKFVLEHNTLELEELTVRAKDSYWYAYSLRGENKFGKRVRSRASGLIGVTDEIADRQRALVESRVPTVCISNGIDVQRVPVKQELKFDGTYLNLLVLVGSDAPWHGVQVIVNGLDRYTGDCSITLYLAGNLSDETKRLVANRPSVVVLPNQKGKALDDLVNTCHVGLAGLSLESKKMRQACSLKVREYWSRGLPIVLGHEDVDLVANHNMKPFYCEVSLHGDHTFALEELIAFSKQVYSIPDRHEKMRALALQQIDYPVKAAHYAAFLESVVK